MHLSIKTLLETVLFYPTDDCSNILMVKGWSSWRWADSLHQTHLYSSYWEFV